MIPAMRSSSAFIEEQRKRFNQSCVSCLEGFHDCDGFHPGTDVKCLCGCVIEPWPWPTGDEDASPSGSIPEFQEPG